MILSSSTALSTITRFSDLLGYNWPLYLLLLQVHDIKNRDRFESLATYSVSTTGFSSLPLRNLSDLLPPRNYPNKTNIKCEKVSKGLSKSRLSSNMSMRKLSTERYQDLPVGYRPICVDWKDLDKCSVCHMDEEYESNLFLQCDKCRMMVHARCYGELEPVGGVLWLCNLCHPEAPDFPPLLSGTVYLDFLLKLLLILFNVAILGFAY